MGQFSEILSELGQQRADQKALETALNDFLLRLLELIGQEVERENCTFEAGEFEQQHDSTSISVYLTIVFPKRIFEKPKKFVLTVGRQARQYRVTLDTQTAPELADSPEVAAQHFFALLGDVVRNLPEQ